MEMVGLMRVKNEARWIERCIRSILPVCDRVLVMDDHSTDGTDDVCAAIPGVTVFTSPFSDLNETRDKNLLLEKSKATGWVLMIDGDEMLAAGSEQILRDAMQTKLQAFAMRVLYLWDREDQVRRDGVYGRFWRPSMFRAGGYRFSATTAGGNFHCGNVPLPLQESARKIDVSLLHFGYLHKEDRIRKYAFYTKADPNNMQEDRYRHIVQGDVPQIPATATLMHAGPLQLGAL